MSGKEIGVLVNNNMKPGVYEVSWNSKVLASGIYFYSIEANGFKDVKKMVLIK